jgi:predicted phage baseplate assembly protein
VSDECTGACFEPPGFPLAVFNRPGLGHVAYRVGAYADLLDELLRRLNRDATLAAWTHREPDDPGIALLECAAMMGDVLTFYQELYANEAFLRTARWRESVSELVRLVGYRLAPGVGGRATFAFEAKGTAPVTVPAGFALKAEVESGDKPTDFQTAAELVAFPALSRFHLYRPRVTTRTVAAGLTSLEVASVAGGAAVPDFRQGDRVILVPSVSMWDDQVTWTAQADAEVLMVDRVETVLDRTVLHFQGALTVARGTSVTAYKLGRTFRHFGADAPPQLVTLSNATPPVATAQATNYARPVMVGTNTPSGPSGSYPALADVDMPLDQEVNDLAAGSALVLQASVYFSPEGAPYRTERLTVVRAITRVSPTSMVWGNLSAPCTVVTLDRRIAPNDKVWYETADVRKIRFHETLGPALTLRAQTDGDTGALADPLFAFYGTRGDARALAERPVILQADDGTLVETAAAAADAALDGGTDADRGMWPVWLTTLPGALTRDDFDERAPRVTVFGNLAEATQGKAEREAVLGNGDNRQVFQTFKLPRAPLTWLPDPGESPPVAAELEVWVSDRLWARVESFFTSGPTDEVYVVRQDADENSYVQFGDGKTGSRLPSGVRNVVAVYRSGTGAFGALKPGKTVQASRLEGLDKVQLPGVASGGAEPETGEGARAVAPARIQSLDRLVSLADVEAETLAIPGVTRARAAWELVGGVPSVVLTVLMEGGREGEFADVQETLRGYDRCRGPRRHPLRVFEGTFAYVAVAASVAFDPTYRQADVEVAIRAALGVAEGPEEESADGLFSTARRAFAEGEWATRVTAYLQNVPGVRWVQLTALDALGESDAPAALDASAATLQAVLGCGPRNLLRLHSAHLALTPVGAPAQEC